MMLCLVIVCVLGDGVLGDGVLCDGDGDVVLHSCLLTSTDSNRQQQTAGQQHDISMTIVTPTVTA